MFINCSLHLFSIFLFSFFILRVLTGGVGPISDRICRKGITILDMHCAWNTLPFVFCVGA